MKRRELFKTIGAVTAASRFDILASASGLAMATVSKPAGRPDILTESYGQWLPQAYGNSKVYTPNISRIARNIQLIFRIPQIDAEY
jgi:hypothetical protein